MTRSLLCFAALLCSFGTVYGQSCSQRITSDAIDHLDYVSQILSGAKPPGRGENIALGKKATQVNTGWGGAANRAVDGRMLPHWGYNSCTHTHKRRNPYWYVDLDDEYMVQTVVIQNRGDCCANRLRNVYVTVGSSLRAMKVCGRLPRAVRLGEVVEFKCKKPMKGKYVKVHIGATDYLTLCEVQVYGNLAE